MLFYNQKKDRDPYLIEDIVFEILYKLALIFTWFRTKRPYVSFRELCKVVFLSTRFSLGKECIRKIETENRYRKIYFKNIDTPIYFNKTRTLRSLLITVGENLAPDNWHYYESNAIKIMPNDIVCDCGAAVGTFSVLAASKCKKVYAIEPDMEHLKMLKLTLKNIRNAEIIPAAVAEKKGVGRLAGWGFGKHIIENDKSSNSVRITTLDDLFYKEGRKVTFIKADIEGYELQMLEGAKETIRKYKPKMSLAIYHYKTQYIEVANFLKVLNPDYMIEFKGIDRFLGTPIILRAF